MTSDIEAKMKWFILFLSLLPNFSFANATEAIAMVPKGKISETRGRDFIVKTPAGTKIQIEFKRNGKLEEANGINLNRGDDLEPGDGLLSLSSVAKILQEMGKKPEGIWNLDEDNDLGWVYEIGQNTIHAKTGKLIR